MKMRSLVSIISVILSSAYMLVYIVHFITSIAGVICYGYKQSLLALPRRLLRTLSRVLPKRWGGWRDETNQRLLERAHG